MAWPHGWLDPLARRWLWPAWVLVTLAACSSAGPSPAGAPTQPPPGATATATVLAGSRAADEAHLRQVEQEVRALAKADGCTESAQCRAVPVGVKECGGPRYWLPYCPLRTDEALLRVKLQELETAEQAFNRQYGVVSDCMYVAQPDVVSVGGSCVAQPRGGPLPSSP